MYHCPGAPYRFVGSEASPLNQYTNHWSVLVELPPYGVVEVTDDNKVYEVSLPDYGAAKNRTSTLYVLPDSYSLALVDHHYLHEGGDIIEEMQVRFLDR